ncbi:hypothetical protein V8E54_009231 [Elaphomyces granulatus]
MRSMPTSSTMPGFPRRSSCCWAWQEVDIPNQPWSHLDKANQGRRQAEEADGDASSKATDDDQEQEPLMDDEITRSQEGSLSDRDHIPIPGHCRPGHSGQNTARWHRRSKPAPSSTPRSTLYAYLVGKRKGPFKTRSEETGGSLSMCVLGGEWRFPDEKSGTSKGKAKAVIRQAPSGNHLEGGAAISEVVQRKMSEDRILMNSSRLDRSSPRR